MDKLKSIRTFIAIADKGSLTSASIHLDVSLPTVVRTLAELERHLGVTLFHRTTRRISLTDEGRRYLESCSIALTQLQEAEQSLVAANDRRSGRLAVTSSVLFGRMHVAPLVSAFLDRYAHVSAELVLLDRIVDLVDEGIDVGVRIGHLPDSSLHAVEVGTVNRVVCASPTYLERCGVPKQPADLASHSVIQFSGLGSSKELRFVEGGRDCAIAVAPRCVTNSVDAALGAVAQGLGAGQFLSYMVEPLIRAGRLRVVLEAFESPCIPVTIVYPHSRRLSAKVRLFIDESAKQLRAALKNLPA